MVMEITTLCFPIYYIVKQRSVKRDFQVHLKEFTEKRALGLQFEDSTITSMSTGSTTSKGKMYSMDALQKYLEGKDEGLKVYASISDFCGENILFLRKVIAFKRQWERTFRSDGQIAGKARRIMFREALRIYVNLVESSTAKYPINIESPVYAAMDAVFHEAVALVAYRRAGSICSTPSSAVTPWDEPEEDPMSKLTASQDNMKKSPRVSVIRMKSMITFNMDANESSEHINPKLAGDGDEDDITDPLHNFFVPEAFNAHVFDQAYFSIKFMVWSETWQRFMAWKKSPDYNHAKYSEA